MPKFDWDCFACSQPNTLDSESCIRCGKPYIACKDTFAKKTGKKRKIKSQGDFYWIALKNDLVSVFEFFNRLFDTKTYKGLLNGTLFISAFVAWEYINNRERLFAYIHVITLVYVIDIAAWCLLFIEKTKGAERRKRLVKYIDIEIAERKREMANNQGNNETSL